MAPTTTRKLHGDGGVFRAGKWVAIQDLEDLVASPQSPRSLPRIRSTGINQQAQARKNNIGADADDFDVCVIGAGCVGSAVARELAKTLCRVVLLEVGCMCFFFLVALIFILIRFFFVFFVFLTPSVFPSW